MNLDRTSLIGVGVCILLYIGFESYLSNKYPNRFENKQKTEHLENITQEATEAANKTTSIEATSTQFSKKIDMLSEDELVLENKKVRFVLDQNIGGFKSIFLKDFLDDDLKNPVGLIDEALYLRATSSSAFSFPEAPYVARRVDDKTIVFERQEDSWLIEEKISLDDQSPYGLKLSFSWQNTAHEQKTLTSSVFFTDKIHYKKAPTSSFLPGMPTHKQHLSTLINRNSEWKDIEGFCESREEKAPISANQAFISFSGFDQHYFLKAFIPEAKQSSLTSNMVTRDPNRSCTMYLKHSLEQGMVRPGEKVYFNFKAWIGPKSQSEMSAYSEALTEAVDLGWFSKISHVFLWIITWLHGIFGNWGVSIIVFTLLLKTLLYPLVKSSSTSMHKMKLLQPAMNEIKEKYKNDPQKQQQETLKFMSQNKVNPLKGCLPILPQFPLFIACWRTLSSSVELRHAPFFGWITDLSTQDPYYVTPLLLGACLFLQQKLTPTTGMDKIQERMLLFMPIMFSLFMLTLPTGMVLYSLTNSLVSIAQQQWLNRKLQQS